MDPIDYGKQDSDVPDFRRLGEASPIPMAALEGASHIVRYVNPAFCTLVGKPMVELIGNPFSAVVPAGDECLSLLDRVYETHRSEIHIGREQSTPHPFYWSYTMWPVLAAEGQPIGVIIQVTESTSFHQQVTAMNQALVLSSVRQHELTEAAEALNLQLWEEITERKIAQEALRESEERYHALYAALPVAAFHCDRNGVIQSFNPRAVEIWGREPQCGVERYCGCSKILLRDGRCLPHEQSPIVEVLRTGISVRNVELSMERPDGSRTHVLANYNALKNAQQEVTGAIAAFEDVTLRKEAEDAVRQSEERFRIMAELMPQKVFTAKPNGDMDYFNQQWMEFTGLSFEQLKNWGWTRFIHPDDVEESVRRWRHALATGEPFQFISRIRRKDGAYRWHLVRANPMRDADGKISMWIGSRTDIQEQRDTEEHLRRVQKLESLGILAGGIAHDFNNLLVGIIGNASMALDTLTPASEARPWLNDVITAGERAARLTQQMLAYSGKLRTFVQPISLSALVREITELLRSSISHAVQLELELSEFSSPVEGDESQIQQVVMNLVINAAESIENGGTVTVKTYEQILSADDILALEAEGEVTPGPYVCLEVQDTGKGMDEATKAKMLDPFFTTKFTGRGLGLAAVSGIMRVHKGLIRVNSALGEGTTIKALFPAAGSSAILDKPKAPAIESKPASGAETVLVVDDEDVVRRVAQNSLERKGYRVLSAENGIEAVKVFEKSSDQIALVLLDMTMLVMSGEETFARLRTVRPDVPIVVSSGFSEVEAERRFEGQGLSGYLQKPYTTTALVQKINEVLRKSPTKSA